MNDWSAIRAEFPSLQHWTYLNTATFGQMPKAAAEAMHQHLERRDRVACSDFLEWFDDADRLRSKIARLIHCNADDIAFVPNASAALSMLIGGIDWHAGDRVVTLPGEFPNNNYYPSLLGSAGVEFVETPWERLGQAITPHTRLVALSTVNYTNGFCPPLQSLGLRERGVLLYVDGTQSVGALEFDASSICADMLAVHCYKWMLAPTGAGFMYVCPELRARLRPNVIGWRSHKDWRNVDRLHHGSPEFCDAAEKYEGGMLTFPALYALEASVDMLLDIGPDVIERRVMSLAGHLRATLRDLGARVLADESEHFLSPIVAARFEGRDVSRLAKQLKEQKVIVSARHDNLRVSVHFYNDENDIERLASEIRRLL